MRAFANHASFERDRLTPDVDLSDAHANIAPARTSNEHLQRRRDKYRTDLAQSASHGHISVMQSARLIGVS